MQEYCTSLEIFIKIKRLPASGQPLHTLFRWSSTTIPQGIGCPIAGKFAHVHVGHPYLQMNFLKFCQSGRCGRYHNVLKSKAGYYICQAAISEHSGEGQLPRAHDCSEFHSDSRHKPDIALCSLAGISV